MRDRVRVFSRSVLGAAALLEAGLLACGGRLTAGTSTAAPEDASVRSEDATVIGRGSSADGGNAGDGESSSIGYDLDAALSMPEAACPPPLDPYWDMVFDPQGPYFDASAALPVCGVISSGGCSATVTAEYCCAALLHGAGAYGACPLSVCTGACSMGGRECAPFGWSAPDGSPLPATDAEGRCITPTGASFGVTCGQGGRPPRQLGPIITRCTGNVAEVLARQAVLEAASVYAFNELASQLRHLGAPEELALACEQAACEEQDHARLVGALAQEHGAFFTPPISTPLDQCSLEELAVANARDGLVMETFAAAYAAHQALSAGDTKARRIFADIARDEISHAALSRRIHAWTMLNVPDSVRRRVRSEIAIQIASLANALTNERAMRCETPKDGKARAALGMPTREDTLAIHELLEQEVWREDLCA